MTKGKHKSPWMWVPSLYLAEGLPYVAVMTISVIMYKRLGVSNTDIALYTSWLYLPWVIKPFWSPFVDLLKTKRWWIVIMQLLIGAAFGGIALTIPVPFFFQATLAFFWLLAFSSATHDIAADGFYMLGLDTNQQAKFVGIRSTFYRIATVFGQGVLIILAGFLESSTGREPLNIMVEASPQYKQEVLHLSPYTHPGEREGELKFIMDKDAVHISTNSIHKDSAKLFLDKLQELNNVNGFVVKEADNVDKEGAKKQGWWSSSVSQPLGYWIKSTFGEPSQDVDNNTTGNIGYVTVSLSKKPDAGEEVVLNTSMHKGDASISLQGGERLVFNESNWNKPAYIAFKLDPKLQNVSSAQYTALSGNIPMAWSITFFVLAGLFIAFSFYHRFGLPRPDSDKSHKQTSAGDIIKEFLTTFITFFSKPQAAIGIFFMLTYRFSEAQLLKLINPFLLDSKDVGGLGLTTGEVGFVYGTIGIIGLTLGGIIGGFVAAKGGLKKWLWPMALSMLLTILTFVYLGYYQPESLLVINICVFIEQFGYGFGFTAYMLYLIYFSRGEHKTAHYAMCTGFMALGMMVPGMFAGWLQELLGYERFFVWVMICSIIPIIAVALLKIDPSFGKAQKEDNTSDN